MERKKIFPFFILAAALPIVFSCGNSRAGRQAERASAGEQAEAPAVDMSQYMPSLAVGSEVPDFEARDTLGNLFRLSSLRGKPVVVDFWASWCGDCRREIPAVKELHAEFAPQGVEFVGMSFDHDEAAWRKCLAQSGLAFVQVSNLVKWKESPVSSAYDLHWIPTMALVSPEGTLMGFAFTAADMRALLAKVL